MFFFFISHLFASLYDKCEGPIAFADPIANATLIQLQVLIRHGARTPGKNHFPQYDLGEWHCDEDDAIAPRYNPAPVVHPRNYREHFDRRIMYWKPSCRQEDLTLQGMNQHKELGQAFKKHYTQDVKFLDEHITPENTFIRATENDRTVKSAVSFIQGMYPPQSPNEVIQMVTDTDAAGILHPEDKWCKELEGQEDYFFNLPEVQAKYEEFRQKYEDLFKQHNLTLSVKNAKKYSSFLTIVRCSNHTLPDWVTEEVSDDFMKYLAFYNYGKNNNEKYRGVASSPLFREMFRIADDKISMQNNYKFVLLSSHDGALTAFLTTFGFTEEYGPAVRTHIVLELWERDGQVFARIVMNGKPIKISFLNNDPEKDGGLFLYSNLKAEMARLGYLNHCFITTDTE